MRRFRAFLMAEVALVLAIGAVALMLVLSIGTGLLGNVGATRAANDVKAFVRAIERHARHGHALDSLGIGELVDAGLVPHRMLGAAGLVYAGSRYPLTVRGALHPDHGLDGTEVTAFVPRDPLSYVVTVGTSLAPVDSVDACLQLGAPILRSFTPAYAPSRRVSYAFLAAEPGPSSLDPPSPRVQWPLPAPLWPAALVPSGAPARSVWYVAPTPPLLPASVLGPEFYSSLVSLCRELVARGGVIVAYGISAL